MEKDITHNQDPKKDIQVYEAVLNFIKDKEGIQLYRRALKICKAYFLLTQHIQDNDSIKLKLRSTALDMSSRTLDLVVTINKTEEFARDVVMKAMALASVSDIAVAARLISESNYTLVVRQVQMFIEEVEVYWKTLSYNNQAIPSHLFEVDDLDASYKNSRTHTIDTHDDSTDMQKDTSFIKDSTRNATHTTHDRSHAHTSLHTSKLHQSIDTYKNQKESSKDSKIKTSGSTSKSPLNSTGHHAQMGDVKNDRQTLILSTIRSKGESSIKDLTDVIKGCSEKTIQRELISLVGSGDLFKTGERRWSRYTIAS
jgi:hypothetical protein